MRSADLEVPVQIPLTPIDNVGNWIFAENLRLGTRGVPASRGLVSRWRKLKYQKEAIQSVLNKKCLNEGDSQTFDHRVLPLVGAAAHESNIWVLSDKVREGRKKTKCKSFGLRTYKKQSNSRYASWKVQRCYLK
jgi:hypothetical protein